MMELDPVYVDVIVKRWEEFTGKKAELIVGANRPKKGQVQQTKRDVSHKKQ